MPPLIYLSMGRSRGLGSYLLRGSRRPGRGGGGGGRALTISGQSEPLGRPARRGRDAFVHPAGVRRSLATGAVDTDLASPRLPDHRLLHQGSLPSRPRHAAD